MADYYSLNELNGNGSLTADVGVSGAFIRLANQDRLIPLISDMKAYERAVRQDRELLAGLSNLNDPLWLAKWPLAHAKQFEAMIRKRAQRLEARRELVQRELDRLRLRLEAWSPGLVAELDHQFIDVPNLKLSTAPVLHVALRGRNLHVSERERVIFKYAAKSHLVICDELADE